MIREIIVTTIVILLTAVASSVVADQVGDKLDKYDFLNEPVPFEATPGILEPVMPQHHVTRRPGHYTPTDWVTPIDSLHLNNIILDAMAVHGIPGVQACVIIGDSIIWSNEYGFADQAGTQPVTPNTLFCSGSISKTFIAVAIMQLVEDGLIDLDADISNYTGFTISNPFPPHNSVPITVRMVLAHVSSIDDSMWPWYLQMTRGKDWPGDYRQWIEDYLSPGGATYDPDHYLSVEPGTSEKYSNYAFTLLAVAVENVTSMTIEDYVRGSIQLPLGTTESSWFLDSLNIANIAMPLTKHLYYYTVDYPRSLSSSDFDHDGNIDLAVANQYTDNLSILYGNGDATFQAAVKYQAGNDPMSIVAADLNEDGYDELVTANTNSNDVTVMLNDSGNGFHTPVSYLAGSDPTSVCQADLNSDGHIDLAVTNSSSNTVSVLLGVGDGTFLPATHLAVGGYPWSVTADFLDADAHLDLAVACGSSNEVSVLVGHGDGTFQPVQNYSAGGAIRSVCSGDFDEDGDVDLALARHYSDNIQILKNDGNAQFSMFLTFGTGEGPNSVICAHLNNDAHLDLASANHDAGTMSVLFGNGDGTFQPAVERSVGMGPWAVYCMDYNADGDPDLAVANSASDHISILPNDGDGGVPEYLAIGHLSHPLWPIGTLRTTARQLASHLALLPNFGSVNGNELLDSLSVVEMTANHYPAIWPGATRRGLGWHSLMINSNVYWGGGGALPGSLALMYVDMETGNGAVMMSNIYPNDGNYVIFDSLIAFSEDIDADGVPIATDNCPWAANADQFDNDGDGIGNACCCEGLTGDVNADGSENLTDLTLLVNYLFVTFEPLGCPMEANTSGDLQGDVTLTDLTLLVNKLFVTFEPVAACQ